MELLSKDSHSGEEEVELGSSAEIQTTKSTQLTSDLERLEGVLQRQTSRRLSPSQNLGRHLPLPSRMSCRPMDQGTPEDMRLLPIATLTKASVSSRFSGRSVVA